jgi:hypothetical protein
VKPEHHSIAGNTQRLPGCRGCRNVPGNNLISASDGSTGFTNGVNNDQVGTDCHAVECLFGGPRKLWRSDTDTCVVAGSTAINAGNNCVTDVAHCGDASIPQLTTDQRGFARQVNGTVDIGAVESRGFTIAAPAAHRRVRRSVRPSVRRYWRR